MMLKRRILLNTVSGHKVDISEKSPNFHMILCGISGIGKSVCMQKNELQSAKSGSTVIALDINGSREQNQIFDHIKMEYSSLVNWIDVRRDGVDLRFLEPLYGCDGRGEDFVRVVESAVSALSTSQRFGSRQIAALRDAIIFAMKHGKKFPDEITSIGVGLLQQDDSTAKGVYERLWTVFNQRIFRRSNASLHAGMINIVSFTDMEDVSKRVYLDIILAYLWRVIRYQGYAMGGEIMISIDEFQNIHTGEGSVIRDMLREGRKFGLGLMLATQTLSTFPKATQAILNQAGIRIFFRQAANEIRDVAGMIDPIDRERWVSVLTSLRVGEAVAVGNFEVNGNEVNHPIIVT